MSKSLVILCSVLFVGSACDEADLLAGEIHSGDDEDEDEDSRLDPQPLADPVFGSSDPVSAPGEVEIIVQHSLKCLDVDINGGSLDNGRLVQQWDCWGGANQKFSLVPTGEDSTYFIVVQHSLKCLDVDVSFGSLDNGRRVQQWDCWGGANQKFILVPAGDGAFFIKARHSLKCLDIDVSAGSLDNGRQLQQWDCWGGANQRFRLQ